MQARCLHVPNPANPCSRSNSKGLGWSAGTQENLEELATLESLDNGKPYVISKTVDVPMVSQQHPISGTLLGYTTVGSTGSDPQCHTANSLSTDAIMVFPSNQLKGCALQNRSSLHIRPFTLPTDAPVLFCSPLSICDTTVDGLIKYMATPCQQMASCMFTLSGVSVLPNDVYSASIDTRHPPTAVPKLSYALKRGICEVPITLLNLHPGNLLGLLDRSFHGEIPLQSRFFYVP